MTETRTDPVAVLHQAPVAYVPQRARLPREGFAYLTTQASLRAIDRGDAWLVATYAGHYGFDDLPIHETEDGLFHRLRRPGKHGSVPVSEGDFVKALAGDVWSSLDVHPWHFAGTPLSPWRWGMQAWSRPIVADAARTLAHDGRPRAAADLAAFLEEDVRLHDGGVLVRCRGPYAIHAGGAAYRVRPDIVCHYWDVGPEPFLPMLVQPERIHDLHAFLSDEGVVGKRARTAPARLVDAGGTTMPETDPLAAAGDHWGYERDLGHLATFLAPAMLREATSGDLSRLGVDEGDRATLVARLSSLARDLRCGRPTAAEAETAVILAREACGPSAGRTAEGETWQGTLLRYLDRFVVPRFDSRDRESEAGLEALAP